jgi:hypothetical protein
MSKNKNIEIRAYIRANPHLNDDILADKYNVSKRSISANRSHITMGTDTDNPQGRAKAVKNSVKKGLTLIKTNSYELRINEEGQFSRVDLIGKKIAKVSDSEAKAIMITSIIK